MAKRYSVAEAKNNLPAVIHEVELGEAIEITRHGRPVAVVVPLGEYRRIQGARPDLWAAYQQWRKEDTTLTDADVDPLGDPDRNTEPERVEW